MHLLLLRIRVAKNVSFGAKQGPWLIIKLSNALPVL